MSAPTACDTERLVAYLYEEDTPAERRAMEAHLASCAACTREVDELRAVRQDLQRWETPDVDLGWRITREPAVAAPGRSWWRPVPAWAQAMAAVLVLAVGAALANLDVRYGDFQLRVGWDRAPDAPASAAPAPPLTAGAAAEAAGRAELADVAAQLRAEMDAAATQAAAAQPPTSAPAPDRDALLAQVRALVTESERRQQRELAFRLAQVVHDLERQRQNDMVRIEQSFGQLEGFTGAEAARQRELLNYLMRVSQQR